MDLSRKDLDRFSWKRFIDGVAKRGVCDGFERECHEQLEKESGERANGNFVPWQMFTRDLTVGSFGQGGALVGTSIGGLIALLMNACACMRLGATAITGNLRANVSLPRQTAPVTAYSLGETATVTKSTSTIDQVVLTPHRISASSEFSRELQLQSSTDIENFITADLRRVLAVKLDKMMLSGSGANGETRGLINTTGVGSVTFGGPATLSKMVEFETSLANSNAIQSDSRLAYLSSPAVRAKLKVTPKIGTTMPIFIWEKGEYNDSSDDGTVNAYRAACTNQISDTNQVIFGDWRSLITAVWGTPDVVVNPYSRDTDAVTRLTVNLFADSAVRHAQSFCVSADAGNQ